MLNWCQNTLIITNYSNEKILKFFENNKNKEDTLDFNCLIELPEELEFNKILDEDKRKELKEKYNYSNPKDWCLNNWGTIWNAVDTVYAISTDEIIYSFSEGYSQSVNSTKRQGLSVGLDYKISDLSKINLKYSTTTDEKGNNVSRIPKNSISLNGQTILFGKLSISGNLKVVRDLEESGEKMEDYNLLNSKLNYPLTDNTQLTLSAENLLDENYETAKGYSTSKRAFYLGYNAKF